MGKGGQGHIITRCPHAIAPSLPGPRLSHSRSQGPAHPLADPQPPAHPTVPLACPFAHPSGPAPPPASPAPAAARPVPPPSHVALPEAAARTCPGKSRRGHAPLPSHWLRGRGDLHTEGRYPPPPQGGAAAAAASLRRLGYSAGRGDFGLGLLEQRIWCFHPRPGCCSELPARPASGSDGRGPSREVGLGWGCAPGYPAPRPGAQPSTDLLRFCCASEPVGTPSPATEGMLKG